MIDLYCTQKKSSGQIAEMLDTNRSNVLRWMSNFNIPKRITRELLDELTPLGLAIWYMDDGSYIGSYDSIKNSVLYTCGFSYEEHLIMQDYFDKKWNIDVRIIKSKYNYLRFPIKETFKFIQIIDKYMHPTMFYKTERMQ